MRKFFPIKLLTFSVILLGSVLVVARWWSLTSRQPGDWQVDRPAGDSLHFLLLGDTGTGSEEQYAVARAMERMCEREPVTAIVLLGDNFYQAGVSSVDDEQWHKKIFQPYGTPCLSQAPIYAALGNHDYQGDVRAQIAKSADEPRWIMPNRFYRVSHGGLLDLVVLDTEVFDICGVAGICTFDFLHGALKRREARWRIVVGHHPVQSASTKYPESRSFRSWALKRELCGGADAYVAGHAHHLEHFRKSGCGTDFFISGGGGGDLYNVKKNAKSLFKESVHGFLSLQVNATALTWRFVDTKDQERYRIVRPFKERSVSD